MAMRSESANDGRKRSPLGRSRSSRYVSRGRIWLRRIGLALALAAVGVAYFVADRPQLPLFLLAAAAATLGLSVLSSPRELVRWVTRPPYLYRLTNFLYALAGTAVVVAAVGLVAKSDVAWDLGSRSRLVVSEATVLAARSLPGPPEVRYYPSPDLPRLEIERATDLLEDLEARVPGSRALVIDPLADVEAVERDGIVVGGPDVVIHTAGRTTRLNGLTEASVRGAFERLARGGGVVCALSGHGEREMNDVAPRGYSQLAELLTGTGLTIRTIAGELAGCEVVLVAGAEQRLPSEDIERFELFLDSGGRLLVFVEPQIETELEPVLSRRGMDVLRGTLQREVGPAPLTVRGALSGTHEALNGLARDVPIWIHGGAPIGVRSGAIALAWTEPDTRAVDEFTLASGPFVIAAAARWATDAGEGRIVAVADADLATNRALAEGGNRDLILAALGWLMATPRVEAPEPGGLEIASLAPGAWAFVSAAFLLLGLFVRRTWGRA